MRSRPSRTNQCIWRLSIQHVPVSSLQSTSACCSVKPSVPWNWPRLNDEVRLSQRGRATFETVYCEAQLSVFQLRLDVVDLQTAYSAKTAEDLFRRFVSAIIHVLYHLTMKYLTPIQGREKGNIVGVESRFDSQHR